jgi:hypothetical protein
VSIPLCRRSEAFGGDPETPAFQRSSIPRKGGLEPGDPDPGDPVDFVVTELSLDLSSIWFLFTAANFAGKSFVIKTCSALDGSIWKVYCLTNGDGSVVVFFVATDVGCSGSVYCKERWGRGGGLVPLSTDWVREQTVCEINTARKKGAQAEQRRALPLASVAVAARRCRAKGHGPGAACCYVRAGDKLRRCRAAKDGRGVYGEGCGGREWRLRKRSANFAVLPACV